MKRTREIKMSMCLPVSITMLVEVDADGELNDDELEWRVAAVRDVACEPSPRFVEEQMSDHHFDEFHRLIRKAKDIGT